MIWSEFWREKIDGGGNGWSLTSYNYAYTLAVIVIILTCHLLRFALGFRERPAAHPHTQSNNPSLSAPSDVRITTVISDLDLKNLIDDINKKFQADEKWADVINRRTDRLSYCARCCKPKDAPLKYLSVTVFENCSVVMLRDFYMDNNFRKIWDKTLIEHRQLQVDTSNGTEIGLMIKKFPLLTPREYILAWRVWEGNDGSFYCFTKECEYPLAQRRKKYVRVGLFRSGWRIKKVSGRNACEIQMVHQEDAGLNVEMAKLAFAKGIWSYVCKMDDALRRYSALDHSQLTSGLSAITLIQKVPLGLDTLDHTRNLINPETCTSSDYCCGVSRECNAREQRKEPLNNVVPNMLMLLGGAICISRGLSNLGAKVAMACILSKLVRRNALRSKSLQRFSQIEVQKCEECKMIREDELQCLCSSVTS
ncbi:hypothetical protein K7X08_023843 [Anisodus acutangulus]|uniref:START domain-containing protein n=2 Tax=Anisodus TaxID=243963 RepID=A0A9Q1MBM3_9SOLA|nr:hypothetical protein K7X08_023843 [Anisodus acutangulus]KAK4361699.1 hypothetical protein RND71_016940 [Anisodus tanguticus]